jgi:argininosuccinate lyase
MKLWQNASGTTDPNIEAFTVGRDRELDVPLAPFDVLGSLAHTRMLETIGLLTPDERRTVHAELRAIYAEIQAGNFRIEDGVEDVHSQVELQLTRKLGDMGRKIHSGRSRNDQVLVDLKLFTRHRLREVVEATQRLFQTLQTLSDQYQSVLLPGYTHLQVAMPSSFGLWFGAYAEALVDDTELLRAAYRLANKNPLGSGAGYGSSFPLDRPLTTDLLGFDAPHVNVVYAQMSRGKTELAAVTALAGVAGTLARLAMDVCLYNSQNFGFLTLPDELTTGSSIMPHKKNPDVAELLRGRCNRLKALPTEIQFVLTNLPSGYHREMQLLKEILMPAFDEILSCLDMTRYLLERIQVNEQILDDPKYDLLFSVERANELVLQGVPFREAYGRVKAEVESGTFDSAPFRAHLTHTHLGSLGNLGTETIRALMDEVLSRFDFGRVDAALNQLLVGEV